MAVLALALVAAGCGDQGDETPGETPAGAHDVSLALGDVPDTVEGNVVTIPVTVEGIEIVPADGDKSGDSGHFHVFVDRDPVDEGDTMPVERGVVHTADNPIKVWGLETGEHTFTVVLGDGAHERIHGEIEEEVTVSVEGPSVTATPTVSGSDVNIALASEGVEIKAADGDTSGESGHYHLLVDPATPPKGGEVIPAAVENKIVHTAEDGAEITGLAKGQHTIWVVVGDGTHKAFDPPVMDKLTVTIT